MGANALELFCPGLVAPMERSYKGTGRGRGSGLAENQLAAFGIDAHGIAAAEFP